MLLLLDIINVYLLDYFGIFWNIVFVVNMEMEVVVYVILCENFWQIYWWWIGALTNTKLEFVDIYL